MKKRNDDPSSLLEEGFYTSMANTLEHMGEAVPTGTLMIMTGWVRGPLDKAKMDEAAMLLRSMGVEGVSVASLGDGK